MATSNELPDGWLGSRLAPRALTLCPELSMWLLGDDVDLHQRVSEVFAIETAPYWAFCWGSGQALARYLLDHPQLVAGRDVVDFGAGCGVAAIAAMRAGAKSACAVDIDPNAVAASLRNAALNGVIVHAARELPAHYDVLLASDVLYELGNRDFLRGEIARGRRVIVSDPLRPNNPRLELTPSAEYEVRTMPDVDYPVARAVVYRLDADVAGALGGASAPVR